MKITLFLLLATAVVGRAQTTTELLPVGTEAPDFQITNDKAKPPSYHGKPSAISHGKPSSLKLYGLHLSQEESTYKKCLGEE